ncbi:hypothetical protein AS033_04715 [Exiguobacterium indicum]|uniref:Uncharacterized protein n=2 Tax=Exiguobacterium indicum TaxID=296995 RepID=A0A0V8GKD1_9BACL|nr:hypothetical protein AS033_04715 [Exiguobacterium enclense]
MTEYAKNTTENQQTSDNYFHESDFIFDAFINFSSHFYFYKIIMSFFHVPFLFSRYRVFSIHFSRKEKEALEYSTTSFLLD